MLRLGIRANLGQFLQQLLQVLRSVGHLESAFWFVAAAMLVSGAVLFRWGEETHPGLNPAT